jgi:hypothetical protein
MTRGDKVLRLDRRLRIILIVVLVLTSLFLFYKKLLVFAILLLAGSILQFMTYKGEIKFSLGHVFFLALVMADQMGILEGILMLVLAGFIPKLLSGDMDLKSLLILPVEIVFVILVSLMHGFDLCHMGAFFAVINYTIGYMAAKASGESIAELIAETGLPLGMNLIYFLSVCQPLTSVIGKVIAI